MLFPRLQYQIHPKSPGLFLLKQNQDQLIITWCWLILYVVCFLTANLCKYSQKSGRIWCKHIYRDKFASEKFAILCHLNTSLLVFNGLYTKTLCNISVMSDRLEDTFWQSLFSFWVYVCITGKKKEKKGSSTWIGIAPYSQFVNIITICSDVAWEKTQTM